MKKILFFALALLAVVACSKFDDSAIWEELDKHEDRIVKLETLCNQMNTNITSLQTIIIALQSNDYVVNIAPIMEGNKEIGYTITFAKSGSITIYHGKDGKDGANGADGKDGQNGTDGIDGKDGYTPKIGVKQHTDGRYYWTLDGTWLLDDNGNMIPATGEDGKDGANGSNGKDGQNGEDGTNGADGKDGITPQLKIEDGYWYLSYDNGATWQKLGKATGNNGVDGLPGADGADGEDGDNIIDSITQDDENVYFNLSDGTLITLPKRNTDTIVFEDLNVKAICCRHWDSDFDGELSYAEAAKITDIGSAFSGSNIISFNEFKYFTSVSKIPNSAFLGCVSLWKITIPDKVECIDDSAFSGCTNLTYVNFPTNLVMIGSSAFYNCSGLRSINFPNTISLIESRAFYKCTGLTHINIPNSVSSIGSSAFSNCTSVEKVYIGTGLTELGYEVFDQITGELYCCSSIPDGTYSVGSDYDGFFHNTEFKIATIGGGATKIGSYAFSDASSDSNSNSKIETLIIEESVRLIGTRAACTENLKYVYCKSITPPIGKSTMFHAGAIKQIYVPLGSGEAYKNAENWKTYASKIQEYDFENPIAQ